MLIYRPDQRLETRLVSCLLLVFFTCFTAANMIKQAVALFFWTRPCAAQARVTYASEAIAGQGLIRSKSKSTHWSAMTMRYERHIGEGGAKPHNHKKNEMF